MASTSAGSERPSTEEAGAARLPAAAEPCAVLGYVFRDPAALRQALTHRSASSVNNDRLEFLGDSVLGLAVADLLYALRPGASVGELTRLRAALVRKDTLAAAARDASIGERLVLGTGEKRSGGRNRDSILADAMEAVLGAIYLDGGYSAVRRTVERMFAERLEQAGTGIATKDPKTRLQELLQAQGLPLPRYRIVESDGFAHRPIFVVECRFGIGGPSRGEGPSRRQAEQSAAEHALAEIGDGG